MRLRSNSIQIRHLLHYLVQKKCCSPNGNKTLKHLNDIQIKNRLVFLIVTYKSFLLLDGSQKPKIGLITLLFA